MIPTENNPERIQLWPDGRSVTYAGEYPRFRVQDGDTWRDATADEAKSIERNRLAKIYHDRDVWCCQSSLVDDLCKLSGDSRSDLAQAFDIENWENVYADPSDWTIEECRDYLRDYGGDTPNAIDPWSMDREELVDTLNSISIECRDDETDETLRAAVIANIDDETLDGLDEWREAAREIAQDNPADVYEWWRVDPWLCARLRDIGEVVIDNSYGEWWGRCTTGQGMLMDGVLQRVADIHMQ